MRSILVWLVSYKYDLERWWQMILNNAAELNRQRKQAAQQAFYSDNKAARVRSPQQSDT